MAMPYSKIRITRQPGFSQYQVSVQRRNGWYTNRFFHADKRNALKAAVDSLPTGEKYTVHDEAYAQVRRGNNLSTLARRYHVA